MMTPYNGLLKFYNIFLLVEWIGVGVSRDAMIHKPTQ
jgi:hypothetical protein